MTTKRLPKVLAVLLIGLLLTKTAFATDFGDFDGAKHLTWSYFGHLVKMVLTGDDTIRMGLYQHKKSHGYCPYL